MDDTRWGYEDCNVRANFLYGIWMNVCVCQYMR